MDDFGKSFLCYNVLHSDSNKAQKIKSKRKVVMLKTAADFLGNLTSN